MRSVPGWMQVSVAGAVLHRFVAHVGAIEVDAVEYGGSTRPWTWSGPLAEDAWRQALVVEGAKRRCGTWLRGLLENVRLFFTPP